MVRCFVGAFLPGEIKTYILSLQDKLEKLGLDCKFVEEQNVHISLSFIGDVDDEKVEVMKSALAFLPENFQKFTTKTGDVKFIPTEKYTRVLVIDTKSENLLELQKAVVKRVDGDVKPPHITLCRVRSALSQSQITHIKSLRVEKLEFVVDSVDLIKSTITRQGPIYESIAKFDLS